MYVIVEIAGLQYKVEKDQQIFVNRLPAEEGDIVTFERVLLSDNGSVEVGAPVIDGVAVNAKVLKHLKGDKVIVFKKKRRKGYRVKNGFRPYLTQLEIVSIGKGEGTVLESKKSDDSKAAAKKSSAKKATAKAAPKKAETKKTDAKSATAPKEAKASQSTASKATTKEAKVDTAKKATPAKKETSTKKETAAKVKKETTAKKTTAKKNTAKKSTAKKTDSKGDDLTKVEGIGPKVKGIFNEAGIHTFADLAAKSAEELKDILTPHGGIYAGMTTDTWPKQAGMAAEGKWDELKKWQDELDGGKKA